jgi:uncharacterized membrane protein
MGRMNTVLTVLHVVGAVFIVGPMAILPMTGLRALRSGNAGQVRVLATSTLVFSLLSLLVVVFGFGAMGTADAKYHLSFTTPWILWSIILYAIALILVLAVAVPAMRRAAVAGGRSSYGMIAGSSGITSLLLLAVVVLMVWKP